MSCKTVEQLTLGTVILKKHLSEDKELLSLQELPDVGTLQVQALQNNPPEEAESIQVVVTDFDQEPAASTQIGSPPIFDE